MVTTWIAAALMASPLPAEGRLPWPDSAAPEGWGASIRFTHPQEGELDLMPQAGFRWVRVILDWDSVERRPGELDFSAFDGLFGSLASANFRVFAVVDSTHASLGGTDSQASYLRFAEQALLRYRGRNFLWEMCPEFATPVGQSTEDASLYIPRALAFAEMVGRVAPGELVAGPSTRGFQWGLLEASLRSGLLESWAAVSVRPVGNHPEASMMDWARLRALVDRYTPSGRPTIPLISAEWGFGAGVEPVDEERQAMYMVRQALSQHAAGISLTFWNTWKDDALAARSTTPQFGAVRHDLTPKPAYLALRQLAGWVGGFQYNKRLATSSPSSFRLLFTRGREARVLEWTAERGGTSWLTERPRLARSTSLPEPLLRWPALPIAWEVPNRDALTALLVANLEGLPPDAAIEVTRRQDGAPTESTTRFLASEARSRAPEATSGFALSANPTGPASRLRIRVTVEGQSLAQEVLVTQAPPTAR